MSSWSSSGCVAACRPRASSGWCAGRLAYSDTGATGALAAAGMDGRGAVNPAGAAIPAPPWARSAGREGGRTGRMFEAALSASSSSSRRPRPTAASRRSKPPLRFSGCSVSECSPRRARSSACAGRGNSSNSGMRRGRFGRRSGAGGMNALGAAASTIAGDGSGNREGLRGMGRTVTSSTRGRTARATAALAAVSIASAVCCAAPGSPACHRCGR